MLSLIEVQWSSSVLASGTSFLDPGANGVNVCQWRWVSQYTATAACHFVWRSCALCNLSHRGGKLGSLNGSDYFLGALNLQISVAVVIPRGSKCLESGLQTSMSLLLPPYLYP